MASALCEQKITQSDGWIKWRHCWTFCSVLEIHWDDLSTANNINNMWIIISISSTTCFSVSRCFALSFINFIIKKKEFLSGRNNTLLTYYKVMNVCGIINVKSTKTKIKEIKWWWRLRIKELDFQVIIYFVC